MHIYMCVYIMYIHIYTYMISIGPISVLTGSSDISINVVSICIIKDGYEFKNMDYKILDKSTYEKNNKK